MDDLESASSTTTMDNQVSRAAFVPAVTPAESDLFLLALESTLHKWTLRFSTPTAPTRSRSRRCYSPRGTGSKRRRKTGTSKRFFTGARTTATTPTLTTMTIIMALPLERYQQHVRRQHCRRLHCHTIVTIAASTAQTATLPAFLRDHAYDW